MRFLTPAEVAALADAIAPRYRALVLVGAYGGLRIGELAGLRRSRVDLLRGTVQVAEIVVEVRGILHVGPPKTRASRRTVGLPRFVVEELAAHLGRPGDLEALVFTATPGWSASAPGIPRSGVATSSHRRWPGRAAHSRPSPHGGGAMDLGRRQPEGGFGQGRAFLGELHLGSLWSPVPGGRHGAPRPPGRALRDHPAGADQLGRAAASAARAWPQRGPRRLREGQQRRRWDSDDALTCLDGWWARQGLNL